jgi:hypothetical protein
MPPHRNDKMCGAIDDWIGSGRILPRPMADQRLVPQKLGR